jgi:hypothetical protein
MELKQDKKKGFDQYEKESFHRTLMEAEMIKQDPAKYKAAMEIMSKHKKAMKGFSLEEIKAKGNDLPMDSEDESYEEDEKETKPMK